MEKLLTRKEVGEFLSEKLGVDSDRYATDMEYQNMVMLELLKTSYAPLWGDQKQVVHYYGLTLTTQVTNGIPKRGYREFLRTIERIANLKGMLLVHAFFELTAAEALHVHMYIESSGYVNARQIGQCNAGEGFMLDKLKKPAQIAATKVYVAKTQNDPELLKKLMAKIIATTTPPPQNS